MDAQRLESGLHRLEIPGALLERGFWLYVWRVSTPKGERLYVGRTGDSSSPNASPPYIRLGQHLSHRHTQNALRKRLVAEGIEPEACSNFELLSYGPIFEEQQDMASHCPVRDQLAALEKALAEGLLRGGYRVMNTVNSKKPLDPELWRDVAAAFRKSFPRLVEG